MTGLFARQLEPIVNDIFQRRGVIHLLQGSLVVMGIFVVRGVTTYFHTVLMNKTGQRIVNDVQQEHIPPSSARRSGVFSRQFLRQPESRARSAMSGSCGRRSVNV